ncbi:hypothetical protein PanWU01x14_024410 [Parasponia andersonii]|uniref:Uncharacterized protein n=1 Tax=Parasponia andersonii TaxID=3476 RepID=A0A2P5DWM0_PARAD|nr:hypothetical protein PanWU01x14_024410 [Parasponia andersonii]
MEDRNQLLKSPRTGLSSPGVRLPLPNYNPSYSPSLSSSGLPSIQPLLRCGLLSVLRLVSLLHPSSD